MEDLQLLMKRLRQKWLDEGVKLGQVASDAEIAAFEARYSVTVPEVFRAYLQIVNGMGGGHYEIDDNIICFYPLHSIKPLSEHGWKSFKQAEKHFVFADWDIWTQCFTIQLANHSAAAPISTVDQRPRRAASNFAEFIALYLADAWQIIDPETIESSE